MEGALLEACVRLSGGRAAGYLIGGALAVSWSMAQRILNALIAFGPDVVRLYVEAYAFAAKSLGVSRVGPFDLIATLVAAEWAIGFAAAAIGLRVARRPAGTPLRGAGPGTRPRGRRRPRRGLADHRHRAVVAPAARAGVRRARRRHGRAVVRAAVGRRALRRGVRRRSSCAPTRGRSPASGARRCGSSSPSSCCWPDSCSAACAAAPPAC